MEETGAGLVPASPGWFVMNARDARWFRRPGRADSLPLTGVDEFEAETYFPMLGMSIQVLSPGEPNSMYHWETEQEDFLMLSGEALLIVEGQERPVRQWDFVHCPPETRHVFVGAGDGPCVILAASSRQFLSGGGDAGHRRRIRALPAAATNALPRRLAAGRLLAGRGRPEEGRGVLRHERASAVLLELPGLGP
jgi:mannose-6-phosphate isomerase-like protein (cupin superfamily)